MAAPASRTSSVPSLPPPSPKSPPEYPDLYGKRREMAKVQMLEREISFLQEELKSVDGLQPASRCCKEIAEFMVAHSDPLLPIKRKKRRSCHFWRWLCQIPCFSMSWICCCKAGCSLHLDLPHCCNCKPCSCLASTCCSMPKRPCYDCPRLNCCRLSFCCQRCCTFKCNLCHDCSCCRWKCSYPKCPKVSPCCFCTKSCCNTCCLSL